MFKKKAPISDLLKSIKAEAKETKKISAVNDVFVLKKEETKDKSQQEQSSHSTSKAKTLDELMETLVVRQQVKFAEVPFTEKKSDFGTILRKAFGENAKVATSVASEPFKQKWEQMCRQKAEKIFSYNSKQYFLAIQEVVSKK